MEEGTTENTVSKSALIEPLGAEMKLEIEITEEEIKSAVERKVRKAVAD